MLLIDLSHTSHTPARTGIQRVARSILQHLGNQAVPVTRDPFLDAWRRLEPWELANLAQTQGGRKRGARWPFAAKLRGRLRRTFGRTSAHALRGDFDALIEPELFTPAVARNFPQLFSHVRGPSRRPLPRRPSTPLSRIHPARHRRPFFPLTSANSSNSTASLPSPPTPAIPSSPTGDGSASPTRPPSSPFPSASIPSPQSVTS